MFDGLYLILNDLSSCGFRGVIQGGLAGDRSPDDASHASIALRATQDGLPGAR